MCPDGKPVSGQSHTTSDSMPSSLILRPNSEHRAGNYTQSMACVRVIRVIPPNCSNQLPQFGGSMLGLNGDGRMIPLLTCPKCGARVSLSSGVSDANLGAKYRCSSCSSELQLLAERRLFPKGLIALSVIGGIASFLPVIVGAPLLFIGGAGLGCWLMQFGAIGPR